MINVNPTANQITTIKKHKKFLEKWKMWGFAYYDADDYYFMVQFTNLFRKLSGYLILNREGDDLRLDQVESPGYYLVKYNTLVHNTISGIFPQMHKSRKPYQQMNDLLLKNKNELLKLRPDLTDSINKVIENNARTVAMSERMREIVYTLGGYQREITRERGCFDREFLAVMEDEIGNYSEMMYTYGLRERQLEQDYDQLYQALNTDNFAIPYSDKKKLMALLTASKETNEDELEKSLETFEKDENGKPLSIDLENIKESLTKNREEIGKRDFQRITIPITRNSK